MATVSVDIDLDEFGTDEIIMELENRYKLFQRNNSYREFKKKHLETIQKIFDIPEMKEVSQTVINKMKIDLFMSKIEGFTLEQLEQFLQ